MSDLDGWVLPIVVGGSIIGGAALGYFLVPMVLDAFGLGKKPNNPTESPETIKQMIKQTIKEQQPTQEPNRLEAHYMIDRDLGGPVVRSLRPKYTLQRTDPSHRVPLPPKPAPRSYRHQIGDLRDVTQRQQVTQARPTEQVAPKQTEWVVID